MKLELIDLESPQELVNCRGHCGRLASDFPLLLRHRPHASPFFSWDTANPNGSEREISGSWKIFLDF
jgi:hypothetical protein